MVARRFAMPVPPWLGLLAAGVLGLAQASAAQAQAGMEAAPDRHGALSRLEDELKLSDETVQRLQAEIRAIDTDRSKLRTELVETAERMRQMEGATAAAESRLAGLSASEDALKASLGSRRGLLVEVIASLQRMGHHPPPALLVRPEDALEAVRTAMLLGAVLPEMRRQMESLMADLGELGRVRRQITVERDGLRVGLQQLAEDRKRLDLLVDERQRVLAQQERSLVGEQVRATALAREASSLKDLIARMEHEVVSAKNAADAAARATEQQAAGAPALRPSMAALEDPSRLSPALPFGEAKGFVRLPLSGTTMRRFGEDDGNGGVEKGLALAAPPSAPVTAPCDGWIVYAGPFRSYGQLLIINAGGGYHVVLAGMERINVGLGQFVLTGEPVAVMGSGETRIASTAASGPAQPTLYVEFRRDGVSIDPTPWWAIQGEKARG